MSMGRLSISGEDQFGRYVAAHHQRVVEDERRVPIDQLLSRVRPSNRYLISALAQERFHMVAEYKTEEPGERSLGPASSEGEVLSAVEQYGSALAVHSAPEYGGSPALIKRMRNICDLPIICADVILRPYQVVQARLWGADGITLYPGMIDDHRHFGEMLSHAHILNMGAIVVVQNEEELDAALRVRAQIIALSARPLGGKKPDKKVLRHLMDRCPADRTRLAVFGANEAKLMEELREELDGILVGEAIMTAKKPDAACRRWGF